MTYFDFFIDTLPAEKPFDEGRGPPQQFKLFMFGAWCGFQGHHL